MAEEIAVIANLTAQSWSLHRNYGAFFIPASEGTRSAQPGETVALRSGGLRHGGQVQAAILIFIAV